MKKISTVLLGLTVFLQVSTSFANDKVEGIIRNCHDKLTTSQNGRAVSYGLLGVETALTGLGIYMIGYGLINASFRGTGGVSPSDGIASTGTAVLLAGVSLEAFRQHAVPLSDSFNEDQLRIMLIEFESGIDGVFSNSILNACQNANFQRKAKYDCNRTLKDFKVKAMDQSALMCDPVNAAKAIEREMK